MNRLFFYLFFFCFLASCKNKLAKDILPPAKMESVLWDIFSADEMANYYIASDSSFKSAGKRAELYQFIFQKQKITKEQFKKSFRFYQNRPDLLKAILDSMQYFSNRSIKMDSVKKKPFPA